MLHGGQAFLTTLKYAAQNPYKNKAFAYIPRVQSNRFYCIRPTLNHVVMLDGIACRYQSHHLWWLWMTSSRGHTFDIVELIMHPEGVSLP